MITPAQVQAAFAMTRVPIVRYARSPELCDASSCTGLDYAGSAIKAYLAPKLGPDFEVIVFRTPAAAQELARRLAGSRRRGNVLLFTGKMPTDRTLAVVLTAFAKIGR